MSEYLMSPVKNKQRVFQDREALAFYGSAGYLMSNDILLQAQQQRI
jgi:hypothetical protein